MSGTGIKQVFTFVYLYLLACMHSTNVPIGHILSSTRLDRCMAKVICQQVVRERQKVQPKYNIIY